MHDRRPDRRHNRRPVPAWSAGPHARLPRQSLTAALTDTRRRSLRSLTIHARGCCCCVRRILAMAKGFRGKSKNCFRNAKPQVEEALEHQVPRNVWLRAALDSFR